MALLIDHLRNAHKIAGAKSLKSSTLLPTVMELAHRHVPVLLIDPVADYYYSDPKYDAFGLDVFPNVAPPFPVFWAEHKCPGRADSRIGALLAYGKDPDSWTLSGAVFQQCQDRAIWLRGGIQLTVGADGTITGDLRQVSCAHVVSMSEQSQWAEHDLFLVFCPFLLAVSFLHCKNVELIDGSVPRKLARKWHARYQLWPSPYKTLVIEPMKRILEQEGRAAETGIKLALHLCRGHFRDYRKGPGLFGKHHLLVWQPAIVRGSVHDLDHDTPPRKIEVRTPKITESQHGG
jgi:hypothetical protein